MAYIAQNPARPSEIAFVTFGRNAFVSQNLGRTWTQIAVAGAAKE